MATVTKEKKEAKPPRAKQPEEFIFVSPSQPNTRFLVRRGEDVLPGENELNRADIFAEFHAGICQTRDPEAVAWLTAHEALVEEEAHANYHFDTETDPALCPHRGVCMSAEHDNVAFWADQEGRKLPLSNREPQLERGYDVEAALKGQDPLGGAPSDLMKRAQSAMARAGKSSEGPANITTNHPERFHQGAGEE